MSDMPVALDLVERLRSWTPRSAGDDTHVDAVEEPHPQTNVGVREVFRTCP
ncbi:hypothetical protein [Terrabacter sp. NPDC000476]|uniref:hypothetical protein n=1 Tax=Terrabacter sp. NPDC000476 TaxID=3154258 RepID=UPI0033324A83